MKTLAERLKYAMEVLPPKKIKGVELARAAGVKPPSVSDWLSGKSKSMEGENLLRASRFLGVDATWLATGAGSPHDKKTKFNDIFPEINEHKEAWYKVPMLKLKEAPEFKKDTFDRNAYPIAYTDYECHSRGSVLFLTDLDDSMIPNLQSTDRIIVDCSLNPYPGCYLVVNISGRAFIRQYRQHYDEEGFRLHPVNERHPVFESRDFKGIEIIGIIVSFSREYYKMEWYKFED